MLISHCRQSAWLEHWIRSSNGVGSHRRYVATTIPNTSVITYKAGISKDSLHYIQPGTLSRMLMLRGAIVQFAMIGFRNTCLTRFQKYKIMQHDGFGRNNTKAEISFGRISLYFCKQLQIRKGGQQRHTPFWSQLMSIFDLYSTSLFPARFHLLL